MTINGDFTPFRYGNTLRSTAVDYAGTHFDQYIVSGAVDFVGGDYKFINTDDLTARLHTQ